MWILWGVVGCSQNQQGWNTASGDETFCACPRHSCKKLQISSQLSHCMKFSDAWTRMFKRSQKYVLWRVPPLKARLCRRSLVSTSSVALTLATVHEVRTESSDVGIVHKWLQLPKFSRSNYFFFLADRRHGNFFQAFDNFYQFNTLKHSTLVCNPDTPIKYLFRV